MEATLARGQAYDCLIEKAYSKIRKIKKLPYCEIFGTESERRIHIKKKLELIIWLTNRKANGNS